jgi:hypothetical protein
MAYRSFLEVLAGFITRLDTPPSSNLHHPFSTIALATDGVYRRAIGHEIVIGIRKLEDYSS